MSGNEYEHGGIARAELYVLGKHGYVVGYDT